jgi:hypothetical protein
MQKELQLNLDTVEIQTNEPITDLYLYRDFNRRKTTVYVNDEIPVKLNVEKLAKKRLGIKNYWNDVIDIKLKIENNILKVIYEIS